MAGDWIKIELALPDKPEVWQIAEALNMDPDAVVGKLIRVWRWFDQQTRDGNAPSVTKKLLDRDVGVTGFTDAMENAGWLTRSTDGVSVPAFDLHNSKSAKNRALTNNRVKRKRNAASVTEALPEKRREENIKEKKKKEQARQPRTRGQRLPKDWQPSEELKTWAMRERPDLGPNVQRTIDNFTDYWQAKTGASACKLDWEATFRNWVRNEKTQTRAGPAAVRESPPERRAREADEYRRAILENRPAPRAGDDDLVAAAV